MNNDLVTVAMPAYMYLSLNNNDILKIVGEIK